MKHLLTVLLLLLCIKASASLTMELKVVWPSNVRFEGDMYITQESAYEIIVSESSPRMSVLHSEFVQTNGSFTTDISIYNFDPGKDIYITFLPNPQAHENQNAPYSFGTYVYSAASGVSMYLLKPTWRFVNIDLSWASGTTVNVLVNIIPDLPIINVNSYSICGNEPIDYSISMSDPGSYSYILEYMKDDDYGSNWIRAWSASNSRFYPSSESSLQGYHGGLSLRVRAYTNNENNTTGESYGWVNILPPPPQISRLLIQHACPDENDGHVALQFGSNVKKNDQVKIRWFNAAGRKDSANETTTDNIYDAWTDMPVLAISLKNRPFPLGVYRWEASFLGSNCYSSISGEVKQMPEITVDAVKSADVSCLYGNDGAYSFTISNTEGSDAYKYSVTYAAADMDMCDTVSGTYFRNLTGFTPMTCHVSAQYLTPIHEVKNCGLAQDSVPIAEPDTISLSVVGSPTSSSCASAPNGSITVATTGGSGRLRYELYKDGDVFRDTTTIKSIFNRTETITFGGLSAGTYYVDVFDQCGSDYNSTSDVELKLLELRIANFENTKPALSCHGDSDGMVAFSASGGLGSYQWSLVGSPSVNATSGTFTNLFAGTYTLELRNANSSCPDVETKNFTISQPPQLAATPTLTHVGCYGEETGSITLSASGGVAPYTYNWSSNNTWNNLSAGDYDYTILDANDCELPTTLTIRQPTDSLRKHGYRFRDVICYDDSASLLTDFSGGWGNYTYLHRNTELGFTDTTFSPHYQPHVAGHYKVWVEDRDTISGNVCHRAWHDTLVVVSRPSAPLQLRVTDIPLQENGFHVSCRGSRDGEVAFLATGGNGKEGDMLSNFYGYNSYTIAAWQDGDTLQKMGQNIHDVNGVPCLSDTLLNFCGDDWLLHVTDSRGCQSRDTAILLTAPALHLFLFVDSVTHNTCANDSVGQVLLRPEGGIAPYYYRYGSGAWQDSSRFTNLHANADMLFTLRDSVGCLSEVNAALHDLTRPITITDSVVNASCYGFADARYYFLASGDLPFTKYTFDTVDFYSAPVSGIAAGTYTFYAWDTAGCFGTRTVNVTHPIPLQAYVEGKPVCSNNPQGYLTTTVQGGTRPYLYRLTHEESYYTDSILSTSAGVQQVEVKDAQGCLLTTEPCEVEVRTLEPQPAFLVSTHSLMGDTLMLVEHSLPEPDSVQWYISGEVSYYLDSARRPHLLMQRDGEATIRMVAYYEGCDFELEKPLVAHEFDTLLYDYRGRGEQPDILNVLLSPNPTQGEVKLRVTLSAPRALTLWVRDLMGNVVLRKQYGAAGETIEDIVQLPAAGTRHLLFTLYTTHDVRTQRIVQQE